LHELRRPFRLFSHSNLSPEPTRLSQKLYMERAFSPYFDIYFTAFSPAIRPELRAKPTRCPVKR
jgi:hypothetical protein